MTDVGALEERIVELEIKVSFQERLIHELDDVVRSLRADLERVTVDQRALVDQLEAHRGPVVDEKPPHW